MKIAGKSKYRNVKCERDGYHFDSLRERAYYDELVLRKKAGDVKEFEVKPKYWIALLIDEWATENITSIAIFKNKPPKNWQTWFTYTPDFVVDGELIDVKGKATNEFKRTAKLFRILGLPIKIVGGKIPKGHRLTKKEFAELERQKEIED